MRRFAYIAATTVALLVIYLLVWPVPIDPFVWEPSPDPGLNGPFATNARLATVERLIGLGEGPEAAAAGPGGLVYTGLQDGRIVRFDPDSSAPAETFAATGGRPLGMLFDRAGVNLIVADAFRGLLSVSPDGAVVVLVDSIAGAKMVFVNDVDIAPDGTIWFSDASQRFDQRDYMLDFLEGRATGRLLSHDPVTGTTTVHLDGLGFANGVAVGPGGAYVLVNETLRRRITRYWISGESAGTSEVFIGSLPGHPDNLTFDGEDTFWVALPAPTFAPIERMAGSPFLRKMLLRIPGALSLPIPPYSWVIGLDTDGNVIHNLQDPEGGYPTITSVVDIDGDLYFGSIEMRELARLPTPPR